jgi:hypothetical protein
VKLSTISKRLRIAGRITTIAVTLLAWLGVCAIEVSPELHSFLHKDAQSPAHTCLVTQLQKHSIDSGFVPAVTPAPSAGWNLLAIPGEVQLFASFDYRLSPSRAPPLA